MYFSLKLIERADQKKKKIDIELTEHLKIVINKDADYLFLYTALNPKS